MNVWEVVLAGGIGAAVIKSFETILMFCLNRKAKKLDDKCGQQTAEQKCIGELQIGMKVLLLDKILELGYRYLQQKEITLEDRHRIHEMQKAYKLQGGNGDVDFLMSQIDQLPLR